MRVLRQLLSAKKEINEREGERCNVLKHERGSILILASVSMTLLILSAALCIDIGWIILAKTQLQNAADAASLAAAAQLLDEDCLYGEPSQEDDIVIARDSAELFALQNKAAKRSLTLHRNDENDPDGGIVVGYIEDPNDPTSPFLTEGVSYYNSVQVETCLTHEFNGPLGLFFGAYAGSDTLQVTKKATATLDDRISGFDVDEGETLPMLPFTIWKDTWYTQSDSPPPDGMDSWDNYTVGEDGQVTSGPDGIPELYVSIWAPDLGIPCQTGNVRTCFISAVIGTTYVRNQIYNGMCELDLDAIGGLELQDDGEGGYSKWLPGEHWMSSSWHYALLNIIGETRLISLFETLSVGSTPPVAYVDPFDSMFGALMGQDFYQPETCCGIYEYYEVTEFKSVTVVDSEWTGDSEEQYFVFQPTQVTTSNGKINPDMPHSEMVYSLSLTR